MIGANRRWMLHVVLIPVAVLFAAPLVWMVLTSLMPDADLNRLPPRLLPDHINLGGYRKVLTENDYPRWFLNTLIVSAVAVLSHVVLCSLAGYGFARLRFGGAPGSSP